MIASDQTALRVGSAKLIVDGTDTDLVRKAEIALRPSRVRAHVLTQLLQLFVNMTTSAKGTKGSPGKGVAQKKGLNRSLQDAALARLAYWICVKAEEAARRVWKVDPKDSSRECIACGHSEAANRCRARFTCTRCGHEDHADVNAPRSSRHGGR